MDKCKDIARMISDGMDRSLSLGERLRLRLHLMLCHGCSNFEKQMQLLRSLARRFGERADNTHEDP